MMMKAGRKGAGDHIALLMAAVLACIVLAIAIECVLYLTVSGHDISMAVVLAVFFLILYALFVQIRKLK
ncbi:MAG: hypothetical protein WCQ23_06455 [Candidatus Methanomethylophilaceae archaeon]|jgi:hypothetical protein